MDVAMKTRKVNMALQGGGAHGAFTWGVLDKLMEQYSIASKLNSDWQF
jgi:predicted acylesterase/phospholipase RssA